MYGKRSISFLIENKKVAHGVIESQFEHNNQTTFYLTKCGMERHLSPNVELYEMEYLPNDDRNRADLARDLLPPSITPCPLCF